MPRKASVRNFSYKLKFENLCTPSYLYFMISFILLVVLGVQNILHEDDTFCIGPYACDAFSKITLFVLHAIYILFWTFILDLMCKAGYKELSWFIFLLPFLLFFILFGMLVLNDITFKRI